MVVEPAGSIEGKISRRRKPFRRPSRGLTLQGDGSRLFPADLREPALSAADGAFRLTDLPAGSYRIQAAFGTNALPEWVADTVPVSVESGHTTRGVQVTAVPGGLLEVAVLGQNDSHTTHANHGQCLQG